MANKYLKRRFTLREKILLVVLLVVLLVGLYFGLVYYPISARTAEVNEQLEEVQLQMDVARALKVEYDRMKEELEKIKASGDETRMPDYNNNAQQETLNAIFNAIFADMKADIGFNISEPSDGVRTRRVTFRFTVNEAYKYDAESVYDRAKDLVMALMTTGYRCSMSSLSLAGGSDNLPDSASIGVTVVIDFYELDNG